MKKGKVTYIITSSNNYISGIDKMFLLAWKLR